jgi:hypothetical protein
VKDDVRYFKSQWPGLPCFQAVISPGLIEKTTEKCDPNHLSRGYRNWMTKKGGQLIASIVCGGAIRVIIVTLYLETSVISASTQRRNSGDGARASEIPRDPVNPPISLHLAISCRYPRELQDSRSWQTPS